MADSTDQSQSNPPSYDQATLPTYQQATSQVAPPAYSPYSSYMGSYGASPYTMPYGGSYYPPSSSTTSMGTAYGDGKGALTQAEALNERSGGDQLHVYKEQAKFDNDKQHQNEGIEVAQMAGAVGIVAAAGGVAAGSIHSTKMKDGKPVTKDGEVVKKTSKTKYGIIAGLAGLGAGAVYSVMNRN